MEEEENLTVASVDVENIFIKLEPSDVENIIIKLEPSEDFLDEDPLDLEGMKSEVIDNDKTGTENAVIYTEYCSNSEESESNIVQTPFFLESYFGDNQHVKVNGLIDTNYLTCEECKIVFANERLLQEHVVTHIDIHRMGCNVCDKDLNMAEKFQLHVMAITRQSIYYCDLCKKSCAGVVRSKAQPRPLGKIYACHDCELQEIGQKSQVSENDCKVENCTLHSASSSVTEILQIHQKNHNGMTCNVCIFCSKNRAPVFQFKTVKSDNCKIDFNLNGSKFNLDQCFHKCEYCDAFFARSFTLSRHVRERHSAKNEDNSEKDGDKAVKIEDNPEKIDGPEKIEDKKSKSDFQKGLKPNFKCPLCELGFTRKTILAKHLREDHEPLREDHEPLREHHEPLREDHEPLKKDHDHVREDHEPGDKKTKDVKPNLRSRTSTKNKFKCNECNASYSEDLNLKKHLQKMHKKVKKIVCGLCLKEFTMQKLYDTHVSFHRFTMNFPCFKCNLKFVSKFELKKHEKKCEKTLTKGRRRSKRIRLRNS